jgi:hypothetical protein
MVSIKEIFSRSVNKCEHSIIECIEGMAHAFFGNLVDSEKLAKLPWSRGTGTPGSRGRLVSRRAALEEALCAQLLNSQVSSGC